MRLAFYGGCIAGPIGHYWFNLLDKVNIPLLLLTELSLVAYFGWQVSRLLAALDTTQADICYAGRVSQGSHQVSKTVLAVASPQTVEPRCCP